MATPTLQSFSLPGALGPILVDVRTSSRTARQPAVLIHHGFKGFKDYAFLPVLGERLARGGFTAVGVSVSGSGADEHGNFTRLDHFSRNTYSRELADLHTVIDALKRGELGTVPPSSIGMVGHSRGGGVALMFARDTPAIRAIVTWAAISTVRRFDDVQMGHWRKTGVMMIPNTRTGQDMPLNWEVAEDVLRDQTGRFDILAAAAALNRPWLLVHGTADETVPVAEARALADAARTSPPESLLIEGAGHTFGAVHPWQGSTPFTESMFDATLRFLSRHLE